MNKIVASVGLAALGVSALQTASAQSLDVSRPTKPWSVSATLRAFYDDNAGTTPDNVPGRTRSFGGEISPTVTYYISREATTISLGYLYSLKYYDSKAPGFADQYDQTHTFNALLEHSFSPQALLRANDSFVIGQEPDMLRAGNTLATPFRLSGNNIRNYASIELDGNLTQLLGYGVGYDNGFYDYANDTVFPPAGIAGPIQASSAGVLDRLEHGIHLDGSWLLMPQTKGVAGMRFRQVNYTADQYIGGTVVPGGTIANPADVLNGVKSDDRNYRLYSPNVGVDHTFTHDISGSFRVGASYQDFYNSPDSKTDWSPYALVSFRYYYTPDSHIELGFQHDRSSSDLVGLTTVGGRPSFILDSETSTIFGSLVYTFNPRLVGTLTGQYQHGVFNGGTLDNQSEDLFLAGLNLEYKFTDNFSAHVGYNYDQLSSDAQRNYERNRVYLGVTASY